ncbi:hypothetical protein Hanom_Chr12g01161181 [Helianthus anomalus]
MDTFVATNSLFGTNSFHVGPLIKICLKPLMNFAFLVSLTPQNDQILHMEDMKYVR